MGRSRIPSLNGLEVELHDLKRGHGVSIVTIEKINSKPHILTSLGVSLDGRIAPIDQAHAAREALITFINSCEALGVEHRTTLTYVLNLDSDAPCYREKLGVRRIELEQALQVGRRKVATYESGGIRLLAEQLVKSAGRQRN